MCKACKAAISDGMKFCSGCGAKVESDTMTKSACPGCAAEQATGGKFCQACGVSMTVVDTSEAEMTAAMTAIDMLAKSAAALTDDVSFVPSDASRSAVATVATVVTPDVGSDEATGEAGAADMPLIKALLDGHNFLVDGQGTIGKEIRALRKELAIVAQAQRVSLGLYKSMAAMSAKLDALSNQRAGRKTQVVVSERAVAGNPDHVENDPTDLKGLDLVAKATAASAVKDGDGQPLLLAGEVARIEQWAHSGATLKSLAMLDAGLGHRVNRAFATMKAN